jgi:two-component system LytT family sensor kinase
MNWFLRYKLDHILFWVLTVFFHGYTRVWLIDQHGAGQFILELVVRNGLLALVIYVNLLVIIPRLNNGKKRIFNLTSLTGLSGVLCAGQKCA